jgi:hypothetical protein
MIAAIGFDDITERGEGFFGQRLDNQFAHAGSSFSKSKIEYSDLAGSTDLQIPCRSALARDAVCQPMNVSQAYCIRGQARSYRVM